MYLGWPQNHWRKAGEEVTGRAHSGSRSRRKGGVAWRGGEEKGFRLELPREDQDPGKGLEPRPGRTSEIGRGLLLLSPKGNSTLRLRSRTGSEAGSHSNGSVALRGEAQEVFETAPQVGTGSTGEGLASLWARHAVAQH